MRDNEKREFFKNLTGMAELYDKKLSDALIGIYWEALKDIPFNEFLNAINRLVLTAKFFPKPVEFRSQLVPDISAQAAIAYGKLEDAFYKHGVYASVWFDDPVIHAVVDNLGGWPVYCDTSDEGLTWYRKDFEKQYTNLAPMVLSGKLRPPTVLHGLFAVDDHATESAKTPVIIGDRQKAIDWTDKIRKEKAIESAGAKRLNEGLPQLQGVCNGDRDRRGND